MTYRWEGFEKLARESECFLTPEWAVEAILDAEILTPHVLDPCCGTGTLAEAAQMRGYSVRSFDLYDWGYGIAHKNFLTHGILGAQETVLMNPPFSLAEDFVLHAMDLGARKIVCFQRFAWWESAGRQAFWDMHPPSRIYICGNRATCWRINIPPEKRTSGTPTAHAWFVWERGQPAGTVLGRVYKPSATTGDKEGA